MVEPKIKLKEEERKFLNEFIRKGTRKVRAIARANVLLLADEDRKTKEISEITRVHRQGIWRIKKRYITDGLKYILEDKPRPGQPRKYTDNHNAEIIAIACTDPPKGRKKWTLELLVEEIRDSMGLKTMNRETVRLVLKKTKLSLG